MSNKVHDTSDGQRNVYQEFVQHIDVADDRETHTKASAGAMMVPGATMADFDDTSRHWWECDPQRPMNTSFFESLQRCCTKIDFTIR